MANGSAHITSQGAKNEFEKALNELTGDHFARTSSFFVVIGVIKGEKGKLFAEVLSSFTIRKSGHQRFYCFQKVTKTNISVIASLATIPGCIGVISVGLPDKEIVILKEWLTKGKVWGDYVHLSKERFVTPSTLKAGMSALLRLTFEDELMALVE
ncbi:MAG: hypothetical protein QG580_51 [Patescibacteria group bacterium]|jgi:hypothetical protein|nr:hypothetical protein [Patescibacteria group bacterium]